MGDHRLQGLGYSDGNIPDIAIQAQIVTLNAAYNPSGFTFQLASIDRTTNATWFIGINSGTRSEVDASALLKQVLQYDFCSDAESDDVATLHSQG